MCCKHSIDSSHKDKRGRPSRGSRPNYFPTLSSSKYLLIILLICLSLNSPPIYFCSCDIQMKHDHLFAFQAKDDFLIWSMAAPSFFFCDLDAGVTSWDRIGIISIFCCCSEQLSHWWFSLPMSLLYLPFDLCSLETLFCHHIHWLYSLLPGNSGYNPSKNFAMKCSLDSLNCFRQHGDGTLRHTTTPICLLGHWDTIS